LVEAKVQLFENQPFAMTAKSQSAPSVMHPSGMIGTARLPSKANSAKGGRAGWSPRRGDLASWDASRLLFFFLCALVNAAFAGHAAESAVNYFRSDSGLAAPSFGALPSRFDTPETLRWRVPLPPGHATPIVTDGKVFLTAYEAESNALAVLALDADSGRMLWRHSVVVSQVEQTHPLGSPATATPACDGHRLYVFFGSYGLLAFDLDGKKLWEYKAGPFRDEYGAGSSPILCGGRVILNQDHDVDSFLLALDAATGQPIWKTPRPDAVRSYATPAVWAHDGREELLVAGALQLASYDPANGAKLWWLNGLARVVIPTPVPLGDMVYMASWSPGGDPGNRISLDPWPAALAKWDANHDGKLSREEIKDHEVLDRFIRMDLNQDGVLDEAEWEHYAQFFRDAQNSLLAIQPTGKGELAKGAVRWKHARGVPYVASPVIDRGILYMVKEGGIVTKLELATGQLLQEQRVGGMGNYFASPVAGDGKVYFASEPGTVSVLASEPDWKLLSSHDFHEKIYATPAFGPGRVYLRTEQALYCFQAALRQ
jgi:outer membrane protein assembly factor BamB